MTQWCVSCVGLYAVLAVGFFPKMNCSRQALAHALKKMITKVYLRRDYLVCAVLQVLYFSSILFRDEESSC